MINRTERLGRPEMLAVGGLLAIAAGLRLWRLDLGWFGVDQVRDIQTALDVATGHDWPMRVVPPPRGYGSGSIVRPAMLPARVVCALEAGAGATRVVAAVTAGTVRLRAANGASGVAGHESTLCVPRGEQPTPFAIEIALPAGAASDLDLYERPDPDCAAEKIAR